MQKFWVLLLGLVVVSGAWAATTTLLRPAGSAVASLPPADPAPPSAAQPVAEAPSPVQVAAADADPPAEGAVSGSSELPLVEVSPRQVHTVPEDAAPPPTPVVLLRERDGRPISRPSEATPAAAPATLPGARWLSGAAKVVSVTSLAVDGKPLQLFGVRAPEARDRCASAGGPLPCTQVAQAALVNRLGAQGKVTCRTPPGQRGEPAFVCVDGKGVDLAGFLVGEGYALADAARSYDYFGAEGVARSFRKGLWQYR